MDGGGDAQVENLSDSFFTSGAQVLDGPDGEEHLESGDNEDTPREHEPLREQDRFLPIANVARIMKKSIPKNGKIAKEAKECVQECVSEFISFITSEASERCHQEKRKTINGEDILFAMNTLGFDCYVEPLKIYLQKYRESMKGDKPMGAETDLADMVDASTFEISQQTLAANILDPNGQPNVIYTTAFANQGLQQLSFGGVSGLQ